MAYVPWDRIADYRRQMARLIVNMHSHATEFLIWGERVVSQLDDDCLGVWVGVDAWNPERTLKQVQQTAFSTFEFPGIREQNGFHWTHFRIC